MEASIDERAVISTLSKKDASNFACRVQRPTFKCYFRLCTMNYYRHSPQTGCGMPVYDKCLGLLEGGTEC